MTAPCAPPAGAAPAPGAAPMPAPAPAPDPAGGRAEPVLSAHLLGVRGSTPCPGPDVALVGGHTSCVAVRSPRPGGGSDLLVLDAGTGFRDLQHLLGGGPLRAHVLLSHLHLDHTQGLPFLPAADRPDARVDLWVPVPTTAWAAAGDRVASRLLARWLSPPTFPIDVSGLEGEWHVHALGPGPVVLDGFEVRTVEVPHKGGTTVGIRVARDGRSLAYVPDHATASTPPGGAVDDLVRGVDVLLHGAPYLASEAELAARFGHGTAADAAALALRCGVGRLVLVHHAPTRTDDRVGELLAEALAALGPVGPPAGPEVVLGRQGGVVDA